MCYGPHHVFVPTNCIHEGKILFMLTALNMIDLFFQILHSKLVVQFTTCWNQVKERRSHQPPLGNVNQNK